jgi:hypothetical protein
MALDRTYQINIMRSSFISCMAVSLWWGSLLEKTVLSGWTFCPDSWTFCPDCNWKTSLEEYRRSRLDVVNLVQCLDIADHSIIPIQNKIFVSTTYDNVMIESSLCPAKLYLNIAKSKKVIAVLCQHNNLPKLHTFLKVAHIPKRA